MIDVGANVGRYTCYMSHCVGEGGRVLAFEPILESFSLLTENVRSCQATNVSLYHVALSSENAVVNMSVPEDPQTRLSNYYEAHIAPSGVPVLCLTLDSFSLPHAVRLIKIDAEGHDLHVLKGAQRMIQRDRPVIIVEGWESGAVAGWLRERTTPFRSIPGRKTWSRCQENGRPDQSRRWDLDAIWSSGAATPSGPTGCGWRRGDRYSDLEWCAMNRLLERLIVLEAGEAPLRSRRCSVVRELHHRRCKLCSGQALRPTLCIDEGGLPVGLRATQQVLLHDLGLQGHTN